MKILFASTVPVTLERVMEGQLSWIAAQGHDVQVVSSPGPELLTVEKREGVRIHSLAMEREISPVRDVVALVRWVLLLRIQEPDVVVVGTPKAGLLGGIAARLRRVPRRVYLLRGARYESAQGMKRRLLIAMERLACRNAHSVVAVSPSLAALVAREGIVSTDKVRTVASGSSNGVDVERFRPASTDERGQQRRRLGLSDKEVAVVFVGRLHPDKGLSLLEEAFRFVVSRSSSEVCLLLAGNREGADLGVIDGLKVLHLGQVEDIPGLLHAADILVLPTQREGFPNVVLEAAASGLPVDTTNATGAVDSVVDGMTGFIVDRADGRAMGEALHRLIDSKDLRIWMGENARTRVEREYSRERVWRGMLDAYLGD